MKVEEKLEELGISLPIAPSPLANYVLVQQSDSLLYLSGAGPMVNGKIMYQGKLGKELSIDQGYEAAKLTGLNIISILKEYLGDLDRVDQIIKLNGYVASCNNFVNQPAVINGASDLFVSVFDEAGKHARSAVATNVLPFNMPVEIEVIVRIK